MQSKQQLSPTSGLTQRLVQDRQRRFQHGALGMVSTKSFPAVIGTADAMMKSADVALVGYEKIGNGHCTAVVRGGFADVRLAVEEGRATAQKFGQLISSSVIPRPQSNLEAVLPIRLPLDYLDYDHGSSHRLSSQALGLLETYGFPSMVGASDAMTKSAEVQLVAYEKIGSGLCTAIVRGSLSNVVLAVDAGIHEAERIGELHAVMVIPRPLDDLENALPLAKLVQEEPLRLPLEIKQKAKELVALEKPQPAEQKQLAAEPEQKDAAQLEQVALPDLNELAQQKEKLSSERSQSKGFGKPKSRKRK